MKEKILYTGSKGQLGYDFGKILRNDHEVESLGIDIEDVDITNETEIKKFIFEYKPTIIVHIAAWTNVDSAESNSENAYKVNVLGTKFIAEAAASIGAKMMYISTDYVFSGTGDEYHEIDDTKDGVSVYGKTKSEGEDEVIKNLTQYWIVRISWVFGINGKNFIKTMLKLAKSGKTDITVVDDQIGSPTFTRDLSILMYKMIRTKKYGIYHATNEGVCSRFEFAKYIFEKSGYTNINLTPVSTEQYLKLVPNQAVRPLNSRLSKQSLDEAGFDRLPDWHDAVDRYLIELKEKGEL